MASRGEGAAGAVDMSWGWTVKKKQKRTKKTVTARHECGLNDLQKGNMKMAKLHKNFVNV